VNAPCAVWASTTSSMNLCENAAISKLKLPGAPEKHPHRPSNRVVRRAADNPWGSQEVARCPRTMDHMRLTSSLEVSESCGGLDTHTAHDFSLKRRRRRNAGISGDFHIAEPWNVKCG